MNKAIEPSEIMIGLKGKRSEQVSQVQPMIRFLARFIDYSLFLLILWILRVFAGGHFPLSLFEYVIPFEFFIWIPVEAVLMSLWGTTPGKFFLKTKLQQGRKVKLDFTTALKRSFNVWLRGIGMGIPILNIFCMAIAAHRLKLLGKTSWDREENITMFHYPVKQWRIVVSFVLIIGVFSSYYNDKSQELKQMKGTEHGK